MFDIITPDLVNGPNVAAAEGITIVNNCLDIFGDISEHYVLVLSHSKSTVLHHLSTTLMLTVARS